MASTVALWASSFAVTASVSESIALADEPKPSPFTDVNSLRVADPAGAAGARVATPVDPLSSFPYVKREDKQYLRATVEVTTVLAVGLVDYLLNTTARGGHLNAGDQRWDLRYDWPTFRSKLTGADYKVDTNHFNTNYISHPFAGTMYYTAARSNHLSVAESFGYAVVGAFAWEYFGELREEVSVNDVVVTPVAGMSIGENMMQLASFFRRSRKTPLNDFFAVFFGPAKAFNDFADGAETVRSTNLDSLGFTRDVWHRFDAYAGGGVTFQPSRGGAGPTKASADTHVGIDLELANLPGYGGAAARTDVFDDGNVSELSFDATFSGGHLADALLAARFLPAGYYSRHASLHEGRGDEGGGPHGDAFLLGWRAGFEYGVHDYDRDRARPLDIVSTLSPIGVRVEYTHDAGRAHFRARLEAGGELAGVQSYALGTYRRTHDDTNLQAVVRNEGYYHAYGLTVIPSLAFRYDNIEIGGHFRFDDFRGIEGLDEQQEQITREIPLGDRRSAMKGWLAYRPAFTRFTLGASIQRLARFGSVGDAGASQSEVSMAATLGLRF